MNRAVASSAVALALVAAGSPGLAQTPAPAPAPAPAPVAAQTPAPAPTPTALEAAVTPLVSTTSPAFVALGVEGSDIATPEELKEAAVAVLNGMDRDGSYRTGFAVEFSPGLLLSPKSFGFKRYSSSWTARALANFYLNAALTVAGEDTSIAPGKATIGFTWRLFDTSDPFANKRLTACLDQNKLDMPRPKDPPNPANNGASVDDFPEQRALDARCRKDWALDPSEGLALQLGFAPIFISDTGRVGDFRAQGSAASAVLRIGLSGLAEGPGEVGEKGFRKDRRDTSRIGSQLLLGLAYRSNEQIPDPVDEKLALMRDRLSFGSRFVMTNREKWQFSGEVLHQWATYANARGKDNFWAYTLGIDFKLQEKTWVSLAYSDTWGSDFTKSARFTTGFHFAFGQNRP